MNQASEHLLLIVRDLDESVTPLKGEGDLSGKRGERRNFASRMSELSNLTQFTESIAQRSLYQIKLICAQKSLIYVERGFFATQN